MTTPPTKPLPANPCAWGWETTQRIYETLGVKRYHPKLPQSFTFEGVIDGWQVRVLPGGRERMSLHPRLPPKMRRRGAHRVQVKLGGKWISVGRVGQTARMEGKCRVGGKWPRRR